MGLSILAVFLTASPVLSTQGDLVPLKWGTPAPDYRSLSDFRKAGGRQLVVSADTFLLYKRGLDQIVRIYSFARVGSRGIRLQDSATLPTWYAHCPIRKRTDGSTRRLWLEVVGDAGTGTLQLVELGIGKRSGRLAQTHRLTRSYVLGELGTHDELRCDATPNLVGWSLACALSLRSPKEKPRDLSVRFLVDAKGLQTDTSRNASQTCLARRILDGHFLSDTFELGSEPREKLLAGLGALAGCLR